MNGADVLGRNYDTAEVQEKLPVKRQVMNGLKLYLMKTTAMSHWAFIGTEVAILCRNSQMKAEDKKNPLLPVVFIMGAIILGFMINMMK